MTSLRVAPLIALRPLFEKHVAQDAGLWQPARRAGWQQRVGVEDIQHVARIERGPARREHPHHRLLFAREADEPRQVRDRRLLRLGKQRQPAFRARAIADGFEKISS